MNAILAEYQRRTSRSATLMERSFDVVAGGVSRNFGYHIPYPVMNQRGAGAFLYDIDGNDYIDFAYNGMSLIHGHAYPPVTEEIARVTQQGWAWPGSSLAQIEFAEMLRRRIPGVDQVRFTNSGSEANMLAVKIARRHRGRDLILKAGSAYHGTYPDLEAGLHGQGEIRGKVLIREFGDTEGFLDAMRRHRDMLAAVIIEPTLITGAVVPPPQGFLQAVCDFARDSGIVSIVDDCLMFRLAPAGSSEFFAIKPDLVALGKFIGGGIPTGAVCGPREIMRVFGPGNTEPLYHGGSFNGNVLSSRAGMVTLEHLTRDAILQMNHQATTIRAHLDAAIARRGLPAETTGIGSVVGISFTAEGLQKRDYYADYTIDLDFHLACLICGLQPGAGGYFSLATVFDDATIVETCRRLDCALDLLDTARPRH
ncbi:aspartate aminotransferase family protein [Limobrevibacterium gyesilva]|uniref:Aminotransferase class III-fold pyridoxal phosphate-dependent enzyme n=1 Tax=Limobrevibacterium gyesilva TaxID=2991712 RepID=A0AA41YRQ2_9PROT|nr:aminotransferase class III-fold pyridoxal phosphate-dependent enzyme [Limobrevibacterium gyesilva]MCW3477103.1 aminotransferase class III-fold pyridoxal phosphate-dependent enzyme [Limobrevibacterium gyesilva]